VHARCDHVVRPSARLGTAKVEHLGVIERIGALLLSRPEEYPLRATFGLWDSVQREVAEAGRADLPVVANLDYGHSSPMGVLPLGCAARVDPQDRTIRILEAAVS
jgi:muramoyltetrapeptide carboxypeptidase LdcA involved in peptidoglycan recycling